MSILARGGGRKSRGLVQLSIEPRKQSLNGIVGFEELSDPLVLTQGRLIPSICSVPILRPAEHREREGMLRSRSSPQKNCQTSAAGSRSMNSPKGINLSPVQPFLRMKSFMSSVQIDLRELNQTASNPCNWSM